MGDTTCSAAPSDALVLFGVTGDLAHKMIFPALYAMVWRRYSALLKLGVLNRRNNEGDRTTA
jgi:glucose-6-phosphate 1-dehydrogenase